MAQGKTIEWLEKQGIQATTPEMSLINLANLIELFISEHSPINDGELLEAIKERHIDQMKEGIQNYMKERGKLYPTMELRFFENNTIGDQVLEIRYNDGYGSLFGLGTKVQLQQKWVNGEGAEEWRNIEIANQ